MISSLTPSSARSLLQRRALQCSFSSVFHLKSTGMDPKDVRVVEDIFQKAVVLPTISIALFGILLVSSKSLQSAADDETNNQDARGKNHKEK